MGSREPNELGKEPIKEPIETLKPTPIDQLPTRSKEIQGTTTYTKTLPTQKPAPPAKPPRMKKGR